MVLIGSIVVELLICLVRVPLGELGVPQPMQLHQMPMVSCT